MTQATPDEQEDTPLDPAVENVRRRMIRLQIVSGAVMFISLMAVFGAVVYKAMAPSAPSAAAPSGAMPVPADGPRFATVSLPLGFSVDTLSFSGAQMLFYGQLVNGTRKVLVFDMATGRLVTDVTVQNR